MRRNGNEGERSCDGVHNNGLDMLSCVSAVTNYSTVILGFCLLLCVLNRGRKE